MSDETIVNTAGRWRPSDMDNRWWAIKAMLRAIFELLRPWPKNVIDVQIQVRCGAAEVGER